MIIPEDFAQVNLKFTGDAIPTGAEMTFGINTVGNPGGVPAWADDVVSNWDSAGMAELYTGQVTLASVLVKAGPNATGPFIETLAGIPGTAANPAVTANTAMLIRKVTDTGGRQGRGRFFLPGIPEGHCDPDGTLDTGYLESATADWEAFLGKMGTSQLPMALLHGAGSPVAVPHEILDLVPATKAATQRRRLRR